MEDEENRNLARIEARALREADQLAEELERAPVHDRRIVQAGVHFNEWLAQAAREARLLPKE